MKKALAFAIAALLVPSAHPAQAGDQAAGFREKILAVQVPVSQRPFSPGETREIVLELEITPGFHVNSDDPGDEFLIPTAVAFNPAEGLIFGRPIFPAAEIKTFGFSEKPLSVFEGRIMVRVPVTLAAGYAGGSFVVEGAVTFQACDDFTCRAPDETPFRASFPVSLAARAVSVKTAPADEAKKKADSAGAERAQETESGADLGTKSAAKEDVKSAFSPPASEKTGIPVPDELPAESPAGGTNDLSGTLGGKGLALTFILVFLGGLALNLTPCVYPLIPITIGFFGGQAGGKKGGLLGHALLYVLGMAATYSALGTLAAFTGSLFGEALRYPAVLIGIAAVMAALALSMFDVYEFRLPGFLSRTAGASRRGFFGTFLMGLTVGVVAAPCMGPFILGLLTYVGDRGSVLLGFWLFFLLALGLGAPFVVLAFFSGSLSRLPRSGAWMVWVRKIFGFILLAMAVYFLKTLFSDPLLYSLVFSLVLFVAGFYLAWIEPTKGGGKAFPLVRVLVGAAFFAAALAAAYSGISRSIDRRVSEIVSSTGGLREMKTIAWLPYADETLRQAAAEGKPVFIDFYADWCIPCQENDDKTFSDPEVAEMSRRFVMLKADMTSTSDPRTRSLEEQYALPGMPTLIFIGPDGRELKDLRRGGHVDRRKFLELMKTALER